MDLHEHLARARANIKPLTPKQKSERGRRNVQKRWKKYYEEQAKELKRKSTSAPRVSAKDPD